MTNVFKL